jgi:GntR family transcriptional regulator
MQINITPGNAVSIYRQITDQIKRAIATEKISVGDPLPSVRQLAKELVVNPNTVAKAYAELVRDGVLESQQGRGYFVAKKKSIYSRAERLRRLDEAIDGVISEAITLDFSPEDVQDRLQIRLDKLLPKTSAQRGDHDR